MGYTRDFIKGLSWVGFFRISSKLIVFGKIIIAYRLLSPRQVGLFGLTAVVLGLVEMLTETGINIILVRDTKPLKYFVNTAFIVSIARGILISSAIVLSAFILPSYFHDDGLFTPLLWAALVPFIRGFINPSIVQFQKDLQFQKEAMLRIFLTLVDVTSAIYFVYQSPTATSLVWGMAASAIAEVAISHLLIRPLPKLEFDWNIAKEIINPGKWVNAVSIISFAEQNFDNLVVGRMLGSTQLGYYQTAYNLTRSVIMEVGTAISQVLLPIYGRIAKDESRFLRAIVRIFLPSAILLSIPAILLTLPPVHELLLVFLKEKWRPALPLLPILAMAAWITGIDVLVNPILIVKDRIKLLAGLYGAGFILMIGLMVLLIQEYEVAGAALAVLLSRMSIQPLFILTIRHTLQKKGR